MNILSESKITKCCSHFRKSKLCLIFILGSTDKVQETALTKQAEGALGTNAII